VVFGSVHATAVSGGERRRPPRWLYLGAVVLVVGYGLSLLLRPAGRQWPWFDDGAVDALEVALAIACITCGVVRKSGRWVAISLGVGLLGWALGDVAWTLESAGGANPPTPSVADAFYLSLYPLAYLAILFVVRAEARRFSPSVWLDGVIVGLATAAVCAAFAFDTIVASIGGSPAAVGVNLAYPVGDLILLAMAAGAVVIVPGWSRRLVLLAVGCALLAIGDTVYLFQSSAGTYHIGTLLDLTWPTAMVALSACVWFDRVPHPAALRETSARFVVPGIAALAGLGILIAGDVAHVSTVALALAGAALGAVGVRITLSLLELRGLTNARWHQAVTDELTGLGNRRRIVHELDTVFATMWRRDGRDRLALLLIDLNHFKEVNDSFGHPTGDELLKHIGPRIRSAVRGSDLVARIGGDEFAIVLTGADVPYATEVATRITAALEEPISVDNARLHVGASIGIAVAPDHATSASELMRCADIAMYRAKAARIPFDTYEASLDHGADRLRLMEDLRAALDEDGLSIYYQPQVDLHTGRPVTIEALIRWPHPEYGFIPPDQFLPLAEDSGLMPRLTAFVLEHAVAQCAAWRAAGEPVAVAVNLSTSDLDPGLPDRIRALLERHALPPSALVLEITETTVMADLARSEATIRSLWEDGLAVSIDDFGTGFSSLAYLSLLAVRELKLDRMFVAHLLNEDARATRDAAIVRSAVQLAHSLGLRVVAEGVERSDLFALLRDLGCDIAQGYVIAVPAPPGELSFDPMGMCSPEVAEDAS
jgi:diguanylate cyclase (GGDEF)-like protein